MGTSLVYDKKEKKVDSETNEMSVRYFIYVIPIFPR